MNMPIDLPTEKFYNDMKKEYPSLDKYTSLCDTNIVHNNINDIKNICKRILRYLENNTVWSDKDSGYDVCILLNYWIYDELIHIFGAESTSENINSAFDILHMMWKHPIEKLERTNYYQKCTPNMNIDNYEDSKKRRNLHEYYVNFDTLSKTAQRFDNVCEAYYKKIEVTKSLYKYFESKCSSDKYDCPYFYKNYMYYNPVNVLTNLPYHQPIKSKKNGSSSYDTDPTSERSDIGTKYTPMGSWIRKVGGTNTNSIGDMDEFSSYTQESGDMFLGNTGNYISYQPM
ncbi:PIR Superfamily Protein [Plasmodium ovale wallikeri]|uniref:PIR Superfamily Protein n=1 Tax=Plasmodium ovale wallikeri TaxID=864142 RepID=A0A1A9AR27_PLAOA|nr:PIR Superfamily Protein [Plasmodium ovale wallikeri]